MAICPIIRTFAIMKYRNIIICLLFCTTWVYGGNLQVTPGQLQELVNQNGMQNDKNLILSGSINGTDIKFLRNWLGNNGSRSLNLADCRIVAGGEAYYNDYHTEDDVIGDSMFCNNDLKSLILPTTLKKIGNYALSFCGGTIEFPASLTWIGDHAFTQNMFTHLHIPATLTHIGNGAFNGYIGLELTIDENHPEFVMEDGFLYTRNHARLLGYYAAIGTKLEKLVFGSETRIIDDRALNSHRANSVKFNEGLESIGEEAFNYVLENGQEKLVIPNSVTHVGARAFNNCRINTLILSDNIERVEAEAFYSYNYKRIHLPNNLKWVGYRAFVNSEVINNENLPEGLETVEEGGFMGLRCSKLTIPKSLKNMGKEAFRGLSLTETLDIQAELENIPERAFYSCQSLQKIILPPTVKRIGKSAFYQCHNLKSCRLPEGLEEIGEWAFAEAHFMSEWHIPASVKRIESKAFYVFNHTFHDLYMYSQKPPVETDPQAFYYWDMSLSVLYVPQGCIDNYKNLEPWCNFSNICEFDATDINGIQNSRHTSQPETHFSIDGRLTNSSTKGLHIIKHQDGQIKKVIVK